MFNWDVKELKLYKERRQRPREKQVAPATKTEEST